MKKILTFLMGLFVIVCASTPTFALNKNVTITSATATRDTVVVKGSTEALAVTVQVRDSSDNIIAMVTEGTTSGTYEAKIDSLSLTPGADYTVYVADYEGGNWTTEVVTVSGYNIVVTNDGNGTATSNVAAAGAGTKITLTATPKEGYVFKAWEVVSGSITLADKNAASTTFVMPSSDVKVKATFVKDAAASDVSKDPTDKTTVSEPNPADQTPTSQTNSGSVKTGDNAALTAAIIMLVASLLGFVTLLMKKRRINL